MSQPSLAVAILSCDKYSDLWTPFFHCFAKKWANCPFPVYLESNEVDPDIKGVSTVLVGKGGTWSRDLRIFLEKIPESHILILLEDIFLTKNVKTKLVSYYFEKSINLNASYLRLRPIPMPDSRVEGSIGRLSPDAMWRTSAAFAIWKKDSLLRILDDSENAWEFDTKSFLRSRTDPNFFCTYRFIFSFCHGVQKGKWFPWSYWRMKLNRVPIQWDAREVMNFRAGMNALFDLIITNTFQLMPGKSQPAIVNALKRIRNLFRFRLSL